MRDHAKVSTLTLKTQNPYVLPVFCIKDEQSRIPLHLLCLNDQVRTERLYVSAAG